MKHFLCLLLSLFIAAAQAEPAVNAVTSTYHFTTEQDAQRFSTLTNETRCIVCTFQNIADSNAPIAGSLREKIYQLIQQKKSDDEIRAYLVKRYGEVILLKPRFNPLTAFLWGFPLLAIALFALIMIRFYSKRHA